MKGSEYTGPGSEYTGPGSEYTGPGQFCPARHWSKLKSGQF